MQSGLAAGVAAGSLATGQQVAQAQTPPAAGATPIGPKWWPSKWGPQDQAGSSNHITPAKVLAATKLIKTGKIYNLDHVYETGIPLFGSRVWALRIPGTPSGGPFGKNKLCYHDEFVASEIGQVGTQFDGLGHIGCIAGKDGDMTGCATTTASPRPRWPTATVSRSSASSTASRSSLVASSSTWPVSRGRMLNVGEEITVADVQAALKRQNIAESSFTPGDAIFFNTGWSSLWMKDNVKYNSGCPGIGLDVATWLIAKDVALTGADTWPTEVVPNPNEDLAFVVHNELITKHGIYNHENLDFTEVLRDKLYEFVYVFSPLRIKGGTGSPGHPIAIG